MGEAYLTDVPYIEGFHDFQAPSMLNCVAALNGFPLCSMERDFTHLDLGCGTGLTSTVLAAALPHGRFWGIDRSGEHMAIARKVAEAGNVENVSFLEASFADVGTDDLPVFDFVTLHGVYSWVPDEAWEAALTLLDRTLAPGGLLFLSYNSFPGAGVRTQLRDLLHVLVDRMSGDRLSRIRQALAALQHFKEKGAAPFEGNADLGDLLDRVASLDLRYVAHEFFSAWRPASVDEVAGELEPLGLQFVGSLPIRLNVPELCVPGELRAVLSGVPDRVTREVLTSLLLNQAFRRDVFIRSETEPKPVSERSDLLEEVSLGRVATDGPRTVTFEVGRRSLELRFDDEESETILARTATGPCRQSELESELGVTSEECFSKLLLLLAGNLLQPFASEGLAPLPDGLPTEGAAWTGRLRFDLPLNRVLLERQLFSKKKVYLASPVAGNGVAVEILDGLFLLEGTGSSGREELLDGVVRRLEAASYALEPVDDAEGRRRVLGEAFEGFVRERLPRYIELGIVAWESLE